MFIYSEQSFAFIKGKHFFQAKLGFETVISLQFFFIIMSVLTI